MLHIKKLWAFILIIFTLISVALPVYAEDIDYTLNLDGRRVPIPKAYDVQSVIINLDGGAVGFNKPEDLFVDQNGILYVADTGNNRIVKLKKDGHVLGVFKGPKDKPFNGPKGVFVDKNGDIFVADTGNGRIVHMDPNGNFIEQFVRPASKLLDNKYPFKPRKVVVDARGYLNVLNENDFHGVITIDGLNNFRGYVGTNNVPFSLINTLIRFFATPEQKAQLSKVVPPYFTDIFLDDEGYMYTTTVLSNSNQIKKINALGVNTFVTGKSFGEDWLPESWTQNTPYFTGITVDDKKVISAVDASARRIYQYDQEGNLLCVFGGQGERKGLFEYPSAIDVDKNGLLYVLDRDRNNIQLFQPTRFMSMVHNAVEMYYNGKYQQAATLWRDVLKIDSNYLLAHRQIGKALYKEGKWRESMQEYLKGEDKAGYSLAFDEYRHQIYRQYFGWVVLVVVLLIYLILKVVAMLRRKANMIIGGRIRN